MTIPNAVKRSGNDNSKRSGKMWDMFNILYNQVYPDNYDILYNPSNKFYSFNHLIHNKVILYTD
jgi:hypothetical protein